MTNFLEHIFGLIGYFFKRNIFNILTGQKRDVTELKLVWPVNKTGHYPKIICSPAFGIFHQPFERLGNPFEIFHQPFERIDNLFEIFHQPFERLGNPFEIFISHSNGLLTRFKWLGDPFLTRSIAVRFTRLTESC